MLRWNFKKGHENHYEESDHLLTMWSCVLKNSLPFCTHKLQKEKLTIENLSSILKNPSWFSLLRSGNPTLRHGKPGTGVSVGYGFRLKSRLGHFHVDSAVNAFEQRTLYFGFSNVTSWPQSLKGDKFEALVSWKIDSVLD